MNFRAGSASGCTSGKPVRVYQIEGTWIDIDRKETLEEPNQIFAKFV